MSEVIGIRRRQLSPPITWPYLQTIHVEQAVITEGEQSFNEATTEQTLESKSPSGERSGIYGPVHLAHVVTPDVDKSWEIWAVEGSYCKNGTPPVNIEILICGTKTQNGNTVPDESKIYGILELDKSLITTTCPTTTNKKLSFAEEDIPAPIGTPFGVVWRAKDGGGDSGNNIAIQSGTGTGGWTSSDGGDTWTDGTVAFLHTLYGVKYKQLYSGTINIEEILVGAVKGRLEIAVNAKRISGTIKLAAAVDDGIERISSTSQEATTKTVFDKTTDFTAQDTAVAWAVYGNGNGVAYYYTLQRCHYYNKNPVTPGDFDKHALILWSYKLLIGDEVKFDASFHHILPNLEEGTWPGSFENALGDIRIAQVEVISGSPTLVFFGW